ncbi:hypothetical protein BDY19DRAFT_989206 [Irpex rosettiformis]|uniref:Uncharacterized protein n=1 Tax=Irpex rosettiformis TaxID=378272 RepID=A0ACB8UGU5_9APHY|nr:hypothetical protein BDY19DRAFT_989206 [Irpex rosettiformis]
MFATTFVFFVALSFGLQRAAAQTIVNGQIFTNGLAIVDAPQPGTTLHAGATQSVAIDISGDGHIPQSAADPTSTLDTHYDSLEVYLISYESSFNQTISSGPELLTQEQGSTVKHINWVIDRCIKNGNYNLTLYEGAHINGTAHFTITPLPIEIQNTNVSNACVNATNPIQSFPQEQSALSHSPFLDDNNTTSNVHYPSVQAGSAVSNAHVSVFAAMTIPLLFLLGYLL